MNPELREAIGKAIYVSLTLDALPWEFLSEFTQEQYRLCGEKAVEAYKAFIDQHSQGYLRTAGVEDEREDI